MTLYGRATGVGSRGRLSLSHSQVSATHTILRKEVSVSRLILSVANELVLMRTVYVTPLGA